MRGALEYAGIVGRRDHRRYLFGVHDRRTLKLGLMSETVRHRDRDQNFTQLQPGISVPNSPNIGSWRARSLTYSVVLLSPQSVASRARWCVAVLMPNLPPFHLGSR